MLRGILILKSKNDPIVYSDLDYLIGYGGIFENQRLASSSVD